MGVGSHSMVMWRNETGFKSRTTRLSAEQLFPLTFKGNSTISNPTGTARRALSSFEYYDDESNQ